MNNCSAAKGEIPRSRASHPGQTGFCGGDNEQLLCCTLEGLRSHSLSGDTSFLQGLKYVKSKVKQAAYTRLCKTKKILTVNGKYPGPTLYTHKGDTLIIEVHNRGKYNISIHWHGVKQPRNPWSDGPEYITQCPIRPGEKFRQKVILSTEEGTLWWHAHSDWSRATVHGAIVIFPEDGSGYRFRKPHEEVPIILGEWWIKDVMEVLKDALKTGGDPNVSDAFTINGQPGDLYPCSKPGTFKLNVHHGKTYLLRIINAAMNDMLFFSVAKHKLTVVGSDASYTKQFTTSYITISPGQTIDALLHAKKRRGRYYMAARAYNSAHPVPFDTTTTTAIIQYEADSNANSHPRLPRLPYYNDTNASVSFSATLRSLDSRSRPVPVPREINTRLISTISVNTIPCPANDSCEGPNGTRFAASMNNVSFVAPWIDILEAYYYHHIKGVFGTRFPNYPPFWFNFTGDDLPLELELPRRGTQVKVFEYDIPVEVVFQGTNVVSGIDHPMHIHGFSFYVVGWGFGNFDVDKDPLTYNLEDPPLQNTVTVPKSGWTAVRFRTNNPGVWFLHCHFERHLTWGMETVFIVKNGKHENETVLPPLPDMPLC